ncbi:MAG TPA: polysaccharide biosynthesis tyrosine autokinase [Verrucomicrobiae bacterium]|jgi:capsular exopolysaccharide synthesis family protein|nr:polysaccharide biosynthesis tyrosine autokinase [Verrucomicrobiae bacterium]
MDQLKNIPQETKLHFLDYWRIIRIRKTVILAVFLLVVITATVVTLMYPESFAGTARITVEQDHPDISGLGTGPIGNTYDPYFLLTEFQTIQSEAVLSKVVATMNLREKWGKKYNGGQPMSESDVETMIKGRLDLQPVRNTKFIEIKAYSDTAQEAADLANQVAESYQQYRSEDYEDLKNHGIKSLRQQLDDEDKKVAAAQSKVDKLRVDLKINDAMANAPSPDSLMTADRLKELASLRVQKEADYNQEKTLLDRLQSMSREDLKKALPTAVTDNQLNSLLQELDLAEQNLIRLGVDLTPDHPRYKNAKDLVDDLNRKINDRVDGILLGLQSRVVSSGAYLDTLKTDIKDAEETDIATASKAAPYFAAKEDLESEKRIRNVLAMRATQEEVEKALPRQRMVTIMDKAIPDNKAVRPNKPLNIILGVVFGLVVGIGLAFFIEYLDTSVKTIDDVERTLQAPVLGVIPQNIGLIMNEGAESPHAEAYRVLRTNILFSRKDDKLNTVVVVSAGAGEGKSTTAFNLATIFAQNGSRVLVVDSDLRRPTLHKMISVTNSLGLTNYLLKQNTLDEVIQTTKVPTLHLMASGKLPSSSIGILSSAQMKSLINELKGRYDFVFFDSPPIMGVSDASILASEVDMTLQVIQYRRYPQPMNIRAKQMIEKVGGNLLGIVLNNINMSQDESYYYYSGYYHDYYYSKSEESEPVAENGAATGDRAKLDIKSKY